MDHLVPLEAAEHFALGAVRAAPVRIAAGSNHVWRVLTDDGEFAVHELLSYGGRPAAVERCQRVMELEVAASEGGVCLPTPVPAPSGAACGLLGPERLPVVVHHWCSGQEVAPARQTGPFYYQLGRSLAGVHSLGLPSHDLPGDGLYGTVTTQRWQQLAEQGSEKGWAWARPLGAAAENLSRLSEIIDRWDGAVGSPRVFSHRDLTADNLLADDGHPVLLDWESAGPVGTAAEIGRTALDNLTLDGSLVPELVYAFLEGYASQAPVPAVGPEWCSLWCRGLLLFGEYCAVRCNQEDAATPSLAFQAQVVQGLVPEIERRVSAAGSLLEVFDRAVSSLGTT